MSAPKWTPGNAVPGRKGFQSVPVEQRLERGIRRTASCWEWTRAKTVRGYGQIYKDGAVQLAHRVMYEIANGPVPVGHEIDHRCRNASCVNPDHLEAVPHRENMRRADLDTNNHNARKMECKRGHALSGDNLRVRGSRRRCVACITLRASKAYRSALAKAVQP